MGRIQDRLHSQLIAHDPNKNWDPQCVGCSIAARKLVMMFNWQSGRGSIIPWGDRPVWGYNQQNIKHNERE